MYFVLIVDISWTMDLYADINERASQQRNLLPTHAVEDLHYCLELSRIIFLLNTYSKVAKVVILNIIHLCSFISGDSADILLKLSTFILFFFIQFCVNILPVCMFRIICRPVHPCLIGNDYQYFGFCLKKSHNMTALHVID